MPQRQLFLNIDSFGVSLFYFIAALAVALFLLGVVSRIYLWVKSAKGKKIIWNSDGFFNFLVNGLLGRRLFKGDFSAGIMHFLLLWGFVALFAATTFVAIDDYLFSFLKGNVYIVFSAFADAAGLMLIAGVLMAVIRRYLQRVPRLERRTEDFLAVFWLLLVGISGFAVEGSRLAIQNASWEKWSFAGQFFSMFFNHSGNSSAFYQFVWWSHALLSLSFIAYIPYSKLFHILAAPASLYLEKQPGLISAVEDISEERSPFSLREIIGFDSCTRCGRCVDVCPSTGAGERFAPRDFIAWARREFSLNMDMPSVLSKIHRNLINRDPGDCSLTEENIWNCTTCMACLEVCPVFLHTPDAVRDARKRVIEEGTNVPSFLSQALKNVFKYNNPWEATKKKRAKWCEDLDVPDLLAAEGSTDLCYFVGCTTSMETRAQGLARSFVQILQNADISFGTLGKKEPCCGDIARRAGESGLFEMKKEDCISLFRELEIKDVVTSSPHCFHTFANEYFSCQMPGSAEDQFSFRVRHYTQVLYEMLEKGFIKFPFKLPLKVTYHDPCYLGRYNRIFDAPRKVIQAIPGVTLVEMFHNRENSLCCGGGGDRMWQEDMEGEVKMSEKRIREAADTGAEVVITTCPLCLIMLEDACKTAGFENELRVMDLNELRVSAMDIKAVSGDENVAEKEVFAAGG